MLMKIWAVMAPVLACAGVGYFWGRTGRPFDTRMVSALVTSVATPCLIVATLGQSDLDLAALARITGLFAAVMALTRGSKPGWLALAPSAIERCWK